MNVLQEAEGLINGDRRESYGDPLAQESRIAALWSAYLSREIVAADVSNMMILLKLSRAKAQLNRGLFHRDSYVDICGYAGLAEKLHNAAVDLDDDILSDLYLDVRQQVPEMDQFFIEHISAPVKLRVWDDLRNVPDGVDVVDSDGDSNTWKWLYRMGPNYVVDYDWANGYAPFTEMLETA